VESLIAAGHSPGDVWGYTPRQLKAWLQLAARRRRHEMAEAITVAAMGARGDPAEMKRKLSQMTKD
jgi:hypothetical protein